MKEKQKKIKVQKSGSGLRLAVPLWWIKRVAASEGDSVVWRRDIRSLILRIAGPKDAENPNLINLFSKPGKKPGSQGEWFIHIPKSFRFTAMYIDGDILNARMTEDDELIYSIPTYEEMLGYLSAWSFDKYCQAHHHQWSDSIDKQAREAP